MIQAPLLQGSLRDRRVKDNQRVRRRFFCSAEVGKCADLILTRIDPLKEVPQLADIVLVFRAGHIVHDA